MNDFHLTWFLFLLFLVYFMLLWFRVASNLLLIGHTAVLWIVIGLVLTLLVVRVLVVQVWLVVLIMAHWVVILNGLVTAQFEVSIRFKLHGFVPSPVVALLRLILGSVAMRGLLLDAVVLIRVRVVVEVLLGLALVIAP